MAVMRTWSWPRSSACRKLAMPARVVPATTAVVMPFEVAASHQDRGELLVGSEAGGC
jgi:hypothetical protein